MREIKIMILLHSHRPSVEAMCEDREPSHPMNAAGRYPEVSRKGKSYGKRKRNPGEKDPRELFESNALQRETS